MNEYDENRRFELLLSHLSEGGLSEDEAVELGKLMELDRALRCRYLEYCQIHALLRAEHGLIASWSPPDGEFTIEQFTRKLDVRRIRRIVALTCAAAALIAVTVVGAFSLRPSAQSLAVQPRQPYRGKVVAQLN